MIGFQETIPALRNERTHKPDDGQLRVTCRVERGGSLPKVTFAGGQRLRPSNHQETPSQHFAVLRKRRSRNLKLGNIRRPRLVDRFLHDPDFRTGFGLTVLKAQRDRR